MIREGRLKELFRVIAPGGSLSLIICLYKERHDWSCSARELKIPVHVRSAGEYRSMLEVPGWRDVHTEELLREGEPGGGTSHERALLISARRSSSTVPVIYDTDYVARQNLVPTKRALDLGRTK
jgi:hypothetical protein